MSPTYGQSPRKVGDGLPTPRVSARQTNGANDVWATDQPLRPHMFQTAGKGMGMDRVSSFASSRSSTSSPTTTPRPRSFSDPGPAVQAMSPGDVLFAQSNGYLASLAQVGSAGGFAGHVMLVIAPAKVVLRDSPAGRQIQCIWPEGDVREIWRVPVIESLRAEVGLHESELLLRLEPSTGKMILFGDVSKDGRECSILDEQVVDLWRSPPMLRQAMQPKLVKEVLADMRKCAASWSFTTAIRAVFMSANSFNGLDNTALLEDIMKCWQVEPICTSVVIIFWQRCLCKLAHSTESRSDLHTLEASLGLILKLMPLKADRVLPGELLQTMQRCGWAHAPNLKANFLDWQFTGPRSGCVKPDLPEDAEFKVVTPRMLAVDRSRRALEFPSPPVPGDLDETFHRYGVKPSAKTFEIDEFRNMLYNSWGTSQLVPFASAAGA